MLVACLCSCLYPEGEPVEWSSLAAMSPRNDTKPFRFSDPFLALALLTRIPVPGWIEIEMNRAARVAWAWPLVGLLVGGAAGGLGWGLLTAGVPSPAAAGLVLSFGVIVTGAMHEDGLADSADGLWGGWDRDRRLEIMRDSRIGAYGVIALILTLGLRWSLLGVLLHPGPSLIATLAAVGAMSRAPMAVLSFALPHARSDGLSATVGRVRSGSALIAALIGCAAMIGATGLLPGGLATAAAGLGGLGVLAIARAKIGGQTGDILGASQQIVEIAVLLVLAALASA